MRSNSARRYEDNRWASPATGRDRIPATSPLADDELCYFVSFTTNNAPESRASLTSLRSERSFRCCGSCLRATRKLPTSCHADLFRGRSCRQDFGGAFPRLSSLQIYAAEKDSDLRIPASRHCAQTIICIVVYSLRRTAEEHVRRLQRKPAALPRLAATAPVRLLILTVIPVAWSSQDAERRGEMH